MNWRIQHKPQEKDFSCSAACVAMLLNIPESEARKICKTNSTGTHLHNVATAIYNKGIFFKEIQANNDYKCIKVYLNLLSDTYPLICACDFRSRYNEKGRDRLLRHAILIYKRMIFDPSEKFECDTDCFEHTFNKSLLIKRYLICGFPIQEYKS